MYRIETWGAQGGNGTSAYVGGNGGYSVGNINLSVGNNLYINVGGAGKTGKMAVGGYNGGGTSGNQEATGGSGGGATHIATSSGLLSTFENKKEEILIVSGGGGGGSIYSGDGTYGYGGAGGGYLGNDGTSTKSSERKGKGGTQTSGGIIAYSSLQNKSEYQGHFGLGGNIHSWFGQN